MLIRRALLISAYCLSVFILVGCTTQAGPAERPLVTHREEATHVNDGLEDSLAELMIAIERLDERLAARRAGERLVRHHVLGRSVENRPLEYLVIGQGRDVILILATIHGNEPAGTQLILQLARYLVQHPVTVRGRMVVLVPVANPDGRAHNQRFNSQGVDLNRNFETDNRLDGGRFGYRALSEPESRFIHLLIHQYKPDRIVSIHQPLTCIDYDGPAKALAECMAKYCDLPVRKLGAKRGSLGTYAGETLSIPIVTLELSGGDSRLSPESVWGKYGNAMVGAILYPELAK
jgi:protein MpaA